MSLLHMNEHCLFLDYISVARQIVAMGNRSEKTSQPSDEESQHQSKRTSQPSNEESYHQSELPKSTPIQIPKNSVLICLDVSPTSDSSRLKTALKGTFADIVPFNGERRLFDQIESTIGRKYFIVIVGKVQEDTVKSLVNSSKVTAIYLCLGEPKRDQIPQSVKIRGFFENLMDLKNTIYHDVGAD
jgi:hypothetical protein